MIRRLLLLAPWVALLATGCCEHKCCMKQSCQPKPYQPPAPSGPILLPPAQLPTTPLPSPPGGPVVPQVGPDLRNYPPPALDVNPSPSYKPAPEVLLPDPFPGTSRKPSAPEGGVLQNPVKAPTSEPPVAAAMAGLPSFMQVKDGLASGRKPTLDGFESLKKAGFRTVIYLHGPGTDVSAVRDLAEKRGLGFIGIETTPEKLTPALDAFNAVAADKTVRPAYVFDDDDGVRAGALWYLHFRSAEAMNDDAARVRARPLGLTDQGPEAQAFAIAIQRYLELR